jgi:hypothetical protein
MRKMELAPGIMVYSDVLSDSQDLINDIEEGVVSAQLKWYSAGVNGGENKQIRDTDSIAIPYIDHIDENFLDLQDAFKKTLSNIFYSEIGPLEKDYMIFYGVNVLEHDSYEILKYGKGQHFVDHIDDGPIYHRRISTVYYLNDNYEGGEINFPRFNISYKPKANELLIFPSTYVYLHSVSEVKSGLRYAVVSWIK